MKYFILSISIYLTFFLFCCKGDELPESCYLEPDPGSCKASIPRFYFDQVEEKCKEFIYGGCALLLITDQYPPFRFSE